MPILLEGAAAANGPLLDHRVGPPAEAITLPPVDACDPNQVVLWNSVCIACPFPRCFNNRFCRVHKRVWDSVYRDINSKKKKYPAQYQLEMVAHKKVAVSDTLSAHKVLEFSRQFPEVVARKKRGSVEHVRFTEVYGAISFTSDETHGRMMCFIEYSRNVDKKYGWSVQQARVKWSYWKQQGVASDQLGEVDGWPNRMMIPIAKMSIAGERMEYSKQMIAESKRQKALTEADFQDGLLSIKSGHQNFKNSDVFTGVGDIASTGLGPSRFTGLDATGLGLFHDSKNVPHKSAVAAEPAAPKNPNGQAAAEQLKTGGQPGSQPAEIMV